MLTRRRCCCTGGPTFTQTFRVYGCVNPAVKTSFFQGQTVSVYSASGGTLLASGTTNSSGVVTLSWHDTSPHTRWVTATTPWTGRNDAFAGNKSMGNGGTTIIQLVAHSGLICCGNVDWALPATLNWSDGDITGAAVANPGGSSWSYSYSMNGTASPLSPYSGSPLCTSTTGHPFLNLFVICGGGNTLNISRQWFAACLPSAASQYLDTGVHGGVQSSIGTFNGSGGPPFSFSSSLGANPGNVIGGVGDPVGGTVTITE